ncbi:hypothetical protein FJZ27_05150 [Candidatus Peribacteria bacterium]|nr:hypothetical protein [Candidatus Peribacteria bacterium]
MKTTHNIFLFLGICIGLSACSTTKTTILGGGQSSSANSKISISQQSSQVVSSSSSATVTELKKTYTNSKYHLSFEYPSDRKVLDEGADGLAASLSVVIVKETEAIDAQDAITVRIYQKPNWSETDGWIGEDDDVAKVVTKGSSLAQIYRGANGDMTTFNVVKSTFHFLP